MPPPTRRDLRKPPWSRTSWWPWRPADQRKAPSATHSRATSSPPFRTSRRSASKTPSRCESAASRVTRSSPTDGTRRGARRSPWCNGCASAEVPICKWSGWRAATPGRTPIPASARCATASSRADLVPKFPGREPRAFGERGELRPDHVGVDRGLSHPGAIAAIAAGDDVLAPHPPRVASDALRHQFRVLDEVRLGFDDAGNEHLAGGQLDALEQRPLVRVARVGGLE